jgi:hypothetical protein
MSRKPTIGELIEREERGEDLQLRPDYQVMFVAMKEALKVLDANGDDLSDLIFNFIWVSPLPMRGRTRKSAALLKEEADALAWGREQIEEVMASSAEITRPAARRSAAVKVLDEFPQLFKASANKRWSVGTVSEALKRRKRFAQR